MRIPTRISMTARKPKKKSIRPSCAKGITVYPRKGDFTLITPLVKLTHYRMMAGRCISTLKRGGARRVALADDPPGPLRDLRMLELRGHYAVRRRGRPAPGVPVSRASRCALCGYWPSMC
jgi:hypothetical protein